MNINISGAKILALTILLVPLREAQSSSCSKHQPTPKIAINGATHNSGRYAIYYGEDAIIYCSSKDTSNLFINDEKLHKTKINDTTIKLQENKPKLGVYTYSCFDKKTNCKDTLTVEVKPAMLVKSTIVHYKLDEDYGVHIYYVQLGANYEVFCTGNDHQTLRIYLFNGVQLQTERVDETTVKYTTKAKKAMDTTYFCRSNVRTEKGETKVQEMIAVSADYFPRSQQFKCLIFALASSVLECTWFYFATDNTFELYFKDHIDNNTVLLCSDHFGRNKATCKVNEMFMGRKIFVVNRKVSFMLRSCNYFVCNNETFTMDINTITQLKELHSIEVLDTSNRSAVLSWRGCNKCLYNIRYRSKEFGDQWRKTDVSTVQCGNNCRFELILPYPETEYEVEVRVKNNGASNSLWSAPAPIFITTKPRLKCTCALPASQIITSKNTLCEPCTLIEDTIRANRVILNKIKSLKEKMVKINVLSNLLARSRDIWDKINDLA